jgi:hypothetical protein
MTPDKLKQSEAEAKDVAYTLRVLKPEDINLEWIGEMVHRLLIALERQLKSVEGSTTSDETATRQYKNARTLDTLRHTFAEAIKLKADCDAKLISDGKKKPGEHRAALQRKFDQIFERERANRISAKPDGQ